MHVGRGVFGNRGRSVELVFRVVLAHCLQHDLERRDAISSGSVRNLSGLSARLARLTTRTGASPAAAHFEFL